MTAINDALSNVLVVQTQNTGRYVCFSTMVEESNCPAAASTIYPMCLSQFILPGNVKPRVFDQKIAVVVTGNIYTLKGRRKVAKFINDLTRKNKTRKVKSILSGYDFMHRRKLIHLRVNRRAVLLEATLVGNLKLVNYLLEECGANVEQTGYCDKEECTSLWAAASRNFVHIVGSLLDHGANINTRSSSQRTAVSIACRKFKMVRYLIKQGANIHIPDCKGRTCLIYSVLSAKICQLLLSNGAAINQRDKKGRDAFYFAIKKGQVESAKVLIRNGADIYSVGPKENTPLEVCAMECKPVLVEYLLGMGYYSNDARANAYELLGSKIFADDSNQAIFYWEKALQIRYKYNLFPKKVPEHRSHQSIVIPLGSELQTLEQLNQISINHESMWIQALLIQLRILGPKHDDTCNSFSEKTIHHIEHSQFENAISLLACLFHFYANHSDPLPGDLFMLICRMRVLAITLVETANYSIEHAHNLVCLIINYFSMVGMDFVDSLNDMDRKKKLIEVEMFLIQILSQLDYILSFNLTEEQDIRLNATLCNMIRRQPQGPGQVGLLHLTIRFRLSTKLVCKLIKCGVDINGNDEFGNTAVHYAIDRHLSDKEPHTLYCLLDHGCHVDLTNNYGYCPMEYLRQNGLLRNPLSHVTLQCLTAKVIKKFQIPYTYLLPKRIKYFVNVH